MSEPPALRILLVEDEPRVREVLALLLTALGQSVVSAASGDEALARLEQGERVDAVLTDLRMPGLTGWDVIRAVRTRWPSLRVGIITGSPALAAESREPVDVVIAKPVGPDALRDAIARLR